MGEYGRSDLRGAHREAPEAGRSHLLHFLGERSRQGPSEREGKGSTGIESNIKRGAAAQRRGEKPRGPSERPGTRRGGGRRLGAQGGTGLGGGCGGAVSTSIPAERHRVLLGLVFGIHHDAVNTYVAFDSLRAHFEVQTFRESLRQSGSWTGTGEEMVEEPVGPL